MVWFTPNYQPVPLPKARFSHRKEAEQIATEISKMLVPWPSPETRPWRNAHSVRIWPSYSNTACNLGPCTHSYSLHPTTSDSGEFGEGQAPSPAVKSTPTSSEDDGSGEEGHSGGDSTNNVSVYVGVGVGDGLDDLDSTPQKTDERRQRYQRILCAFNAKRANRQKSVIETNSGRVPDPPSGSGEDDSYFRSRTGGSGRSGSDSANNTMGSGNESAPTSPSSQDGGEGTSGGREGKSAPPSHAPSYFTSMSDSGAEVA